MRVCACERVEHCAQCQCHGQGQGQGHGHGQCQNTKKPNNPRKPTPSLIAPSRPIRGEACLASKTNFWLSSSMPSCLNLLECVASFSPLPCLFAIRLLLLLYYSIIDDDCSREKYIDVERFFLHHAYHPWPI